MKTKDRRTGRGQKEAVKRKRKVKAPVKGKAPKPLTGPVLRKDAYPVMLSGLVELMEEARLQAVRRVNAVMTASYWEIGRRIVEQEQGGEQRAGYGEELIERLSKDLTGHFGRGFSQTNLKTMRLFYLAFRSAGLGPKTAPGERARKSQTLSDLSVEARLAALAKAFPLSWSHYAMLVQRTRDEYELRFYHAESLAGAWSVRQLERHMDSLFYQRTAHSRDKLTMLRKGRVAVPADRMDLDEHVRDPVILTFLGLKDEYSENELEEALVLHMERFLLEMGIGFAFIARQRRILIGGEYFKADLILFHRGLRCLVVLDLKVRAYKHSDASQLNTYLNYAEEHWMMPGENPPVGLILCSRKNDALVKYSTGNIGDRMLVREFMTQLPDRHVLERKLKQLRRELTGPMRRSTGRKEKPDSV